MRGVPSRFESAAGVLLLVVVGLEDFRASLVATLAQECWRATGGGAVGGGWHLIPGWRQSWWSGVGGLKDVQERQCLPFHHLGSNGCPLLDKIRVIVVEGKCWWTIGRYFKFLTAVEEVPDDGIYGFLIIMTSFPCLTHLRVI